MLMAGMGKSSNTTKRRRAAWIERGLLTFVAVLSLAWSAWWVWDLSRQPGAALVVERGVSGFEAAYERVLFREATPEAIAARLAMRLEQTPRDWLVIEGLLALAEAQDLRLPEPLLHFNSILSHRTMAGSPRGWPVPPVRGICVTATCRGR